MIAFSNAKLVLYHEIVRGCLAVDGEDIASVDSGAGSTGIDCEGDYLIAGLVELHTDNVERHFMPRPSAYWPNGLAAAMAHDREIASAGITTVFDALSVGAYDGANSPRRTLFSDMVNSIEGGKEKGVFKVDHHLHFRCELSDGGLMEVLEPIAKRKDLRLVSLMDHTPGQRQWRDIDALRTYMTRTGKSPEVIDQAIQERIANGSRHVPANWRAVVDLFAGRDLVLATHDDTTREDIAMANDEGIRISEFPCSMEAAKEAHGKGMVTIGGAPNIVRGGSHSGNVAIADIAGAGHLDALSSDYVPASLLQAPFALAQQKNLPLHECLRTVTSGPADMVGLTDRGRLEAGKRADVIRVGLIDETPVIKAVYVGGVQVS